MSELNSSKLKYTISNVVFILIFKVLLNFIESNESNL
jgi:hypothetical protein